MLVASWVLGAACTPNAPVSPLASATPVVEAMPVVVEPVVVEESEPEPEPEPRRACSKPVATGPVELTIVDLLGRPIAGAEVTSSVEVDDAMVRKRLVADAQGRLTVPPQVSLAVAAPGFVALEHVGTLDPPRIHMLPASTISGRARDAVSGSPLAGVEVLAVDHLGERDAAGAGRVKSDARGRFRITGLAPGRYYLVTEDARRRGIHGVAVGLGESVDDVEVLAHRLVRVEGRVRTDRGGTCTSGYVTLNVGDTPGHGCTCSGEPNTVTSGLDPKTGVARFLVAPGQTYGVEAVCHDHLSATHKPIAVRRADIRGLKWTVRRGLTLRGRVLDEAGKPLAGATITAKGDDDEDNVGAETDARGEFTLAGLPPGSLELLVDAWREGGFLIGEQNVELDTEDITDLEISTEFHTHDEDEEGPAGDCEVPAPWPELRGVVVDAGGAPVANAAVVRYQGERPSEALAAIGSWYGAAPVLTDERGAFRIPIDPKERRCKSGSCEDSLIAYRIGGGEGRTPTPAQGQTAEIRVGARATIVGTLKTAQGELVTSFGSTLDQGTMYPPIDYQYDPAGAFELPGVLPDSFVFGAHTPAGDGGQRITVEAGQKLRVDLVVAPAREE